MIRIRAGEGRGDATVGQKWPDCDADVRRWVEEMAQRLTQVLGDRHVGTYLHGSLASGSFHPPKSDVDMLFVADGSLEVERREAFARVCVEVTRERPLVGSLECSVVTAAAAARPVLDLPFEVHFGDEHVDAILSGRIDYGGLRTDADLVAHIRALHEFGVCLSGRPIAQVFGTVDRADFMASVGADLRWILEDEHLLESPFYGVLNACRALWLWERGSERWVPTKDEAGVWALGTLPARLRPTVVEALDAYRDDGPVAVDGRRTAGRTWDRAALLTFRDHIRSLWPEWRPS